MGTLSNTHTRLAQQLEAELKAKGTEKRAHVSDAASDRIQLTDGGSRSSTSTCALLPQQ
jgi:hypothetical protein